MFFLCHRENRMSGQKKYPNHWEQVIGILFLYIIFLQGELPYPPATAGVDNGKHDFLVGAVAEMDIEIYHGYGV